MLEQGVAIPSIVLQCLVKTLLGISLWWSEGEAYHFYLRGGCMIKQFISVYFSVVGQ